jgi:hypothetical protein
LRGQEGSPVIAKVSVFIGEFLQIIFIKHLFTVSYCYRVSRARRLT